MLHPNPNAPVIAIDGLARTGKGTARKNVLLRLPPGWHSLDSGILYRLLALLGRTRGIVSTTAVDEDALCELATTMDFTMRDDLVIYRGVDQTTQLRSPEIGTLASFIGTMQKVRQALRSQNLSRRQLPGLVTDGRDQGALFATPFAFFLETSVEVKARWHQDWLESQGQQRGDVKEHIRWIGERDRYDRNRSVDPTIPCAGAHVIDTSDMTQDQVADEILSVCRQRGLVLPV